MSVLKPERTRLRLIEGVGKTTDIELWDVSAPTRSCEPASKPWPIKADTATWDPADVDPALRQRYYARQQEVRRLCENVDRLRYAVVDLAAIDLPPTQIIEAMSPGFDEPIVRDRLARAADCLMRFIEEWERHELRRRPGEK